MLYRGYVPFALDGPLNLLTVGEIFEQRWLWICAKVANRSLALCIHQLSSLAGSNRASFQFRGVLRH